VTMARIDILRLSEQEVTRLRALDAKVGTDRHVACLILGAVEYVTWRFLTARRAAVETALREWWAQGCREIV
jgi:hypothetical protein